MKTRFSAMQSALLALIFGLIQTVFAQVPMISSFSQSGDLVCMNLAPGSLAAVESSSSLAAPWTSVAGLESVLVDASGMIHVSVPTSAPVMFYRVRGTPRPTVVLGIETSTASINLNESGSATLAVRLTAQPPATTTVNVSSGDPSAATAGPATLTFTTANWNTLQTVTVAGVADADLNSESVTLTLASSGLSTRTVTATVTDDDTQIILASVASLAIGEAGNGNFSVHLGFQPNATLTVTLGSANPAKATVGPTTLIFTPANFAIPQTVTVAGVADVDLANESVIVTASAPGAISRTVVVSVMDDDVQSILASPNPLDMIEGDIDYLGVRLAFQPAANVTVTVTCSNTTVATVSPASVTFTPANWSAIQEITVTSNYESAIRNRSATLTLSASGLTNSTVPVFVTDLAL